MVEKKRATEKDPRKTKMSDGDRERNRWRVPQAGLMAGSASGSDDRFRLVSENPVFVWIGKREGKIRKFSGSVSAALYGRGRGVLRQCLFIVCTFGRGAVIGEMTRYYRDRDAETAGKKGKRIGIQQKGQGGDPEDPVHEDAPLSVGEKAKNGEKEIGKG